MSKKINYLNIFFQTKLQQKLTLVCFHLSPFLSQKKNSTKNLKKTLIRKTLCHHWVTGKLLKKTSVFVSIQMIHINNCSEPSSQSLERIFMNTFLDFLTIFSSVYNPVLYGSDIKSRLKKAIDFTKKCSGHEFCVRRRTGRDVRTERILWNDWSMTLNTRPQVNFPNASTLYSILDDRPRGKTLVWGDVMRRRERNLQDILSMWCFV